MFLLEFMGNLGILGKIYWNFAALVCSFQFILLQRSLSHHFILSSCFLSVFKASFSHPVFCLFLITLFSHTVFCLSLQMLMG